MVFKDYKRTPKIRNPNEYTELFFLDEATSLSAGHRPCGQCRYKDYMRFIENWIKGNEKPPGTSIKDIDSQLHVERVTRIREKVTYLKYINELPEGVFVELEGEPGTSWLLWNGELLSWQPEGYGKRRPTPEGAIVNVLTPRSIVNTIFAGYRPHVHHQK